jgi:hypothetical protein
MLTEVSQRSEIHQANADGLIPINCYSLISIGSGSFQGGLTVEARSKHKMVILTVRPTYSILNRSSADFRVQPIFLSPSVRGPQTHGKWSGIPLEPVTLLPAQQQQEEDGNSNNTKNKNNKATPLTLIYSDTENVAAAAAADDDDNTFQSTGPLHLAISPAQDSSPWWFLQLIDFSLIFNTINSSHGIPSAAISLTIPKYDAEFLPPPPNPKDACDDDDDSALITVTIPILASWTCKHGSVCISLSDDLCPQVLLHNNTNTSFIYTESVGSQPLPRIMQEGGRSGSQSFEQYLVLPPRSKGHYTFLEKYNGFPGLSPQKKVLPYLLLTKLPQDLRDFMSHSPAQSPSNSESKLERRGTLLIPGIGLKWSKALKLDGEPSQYLSVGEYVDVKISVEELGFTHYVFIERMSNVEVAARDVRKRIMQQFSNSMRVEEAIPPILNVQQLPPQPVKESRPSNLVKRVRFNTEYVKLINVPSV